MTTPDLQQSENFLEPALLIPIKGKVYRIEPLSAENARIMRNATNAAAKARAEGKTAEEMKEIKLEGVGDDETPEDAERRIFGATYDELIADGVSDASRFRMTQVIMIWTFQGFDAAKAYVATGGKALTLPNRADRRRTATQTRTGAANTTRSKNSATTTSTRKATGAKAVAGTTSSPTGTSSKPTSTTTTA